MSEEISRKGSVERLNVAEEPPPDRIRLGQWLGLASGHDRAAEGPKLLDQVIVLLSVGLMAGVSAPDHQGFFEQEVHVRGVVEPIDKLQSLTSVRSCEGVPESPKEPKLEAVLLVQFRNAEPGTLRHFGLAHQTDVTAAVVRTQSFMRP